MAIEGQGFFIMEGEGGETTFTRAGNFTVNENGYLVGPNGERVQGWEATNQGGQTQIVGNVADYDDINLQSVSSVAEATQNYAPRANLDADATAPTAAFDPGDTDSYNFKSDVTVYDSQGGSHVLSVYYRKTADNNWDWHALANSTEVDADGNGTVDSSDAPGSSGDLFDTDGDGVTDLSRIGEGSLIFDSDGALQSEQDALAGGGTAVSSVNVTTPWVNGSNAGQTIEFDFGTAINSTTDGGNGLDGVVQRAGQSVLFSAEADGRATGSLQSFSVDSDGVLVGRFDNGTTEPLFKVALADFVNPDALERRGSNEFASTSQSGDPVIKEPNTGGAGSIRGYSLEDSNVNAADEFVKMIAIQRGYQANTKVITTVDQMLQSLMAVK
jgi:flagellar hook protein FlgE